MSPVKPSNAEDRIERLEKKIEELFRILLTAVPLLKNPATLTELEEMFLEGEDIYKKKTTEEASPEIIKKTEKMDKKRAKKRYVG